MLETKTTSRTQILEATFRTLAEKGSAATGLREVAREAGVALSQIHYYFRNKDGLLVAAAAFVMQHRLAELQVELESTATPAARVSKAIRFIRAQSQQDSAWLKVYLDLLSMAAWNPALAEETRRLQEDLVAVILSEAGRTGRAELQSKPVARVVLAALDGLALQTLQGADAAEMADAYAALEQLLTALTH